MQTEIEPNRSKALQLKKNCIHEIAKNKRIRRKKCQTNG